jgi:hypothetical protein
VGETLACGTGASAAAVVATVLGRVDPTKPVHAHLTGGDLTLRVDFSPTAASTCPLSTDRSVPSSLPVVSASHFPTCRVDRGGQGQVPVHRAGVDGRTG